MAASAVALVLSLFVVAGLVYDGGLILAAHRRAFNEAAAAARAGTQAISGSTLAGGGPVETDPARAEAAAQAYLAATGHAGSVTVQGDMVEVTVSIPYQTGDPGRGRPGRHHRHRHRAVPRPARCHPGRAMTGPAAPGRGLYAPGDVVKGLAALAAIAVLLVGVPVVALPRLGWPLPHGIPTPSGLADTLLHQGLSFAVVLRAAAAVLWVAWAVLGSCVVVEAVAWARRREARPLRGLGGVQSLAYSLVTAAVLVLPSLSHLAVPAAAAEVVAARPAAVGVPFERSWPAVAAPPMTVEVAADAAASTSTADAPRAYIVQRYDCLWNLAEEHLGDPLRWRELEALTAAVVQPDGRRLGDPNLIYPGWTVLFPSEAVGLDDVDASSYAPPPRPSPSPGADATSFDVDDSQEQVPAPLASERETSTAAPEGALPTTAASPPVTADGASPAAPSILCFGADDRGSGPRPVPAGDGPGPRAVGTGGGRRGCVGPGGGRLRVAHVA